MEKVFVALDEMTKEEIFSFLESHKNDIVNIKIGLEAYLNYSKNLIEEIQNKYNFNIFLDLKLHDIPNTVFGAIKSLSGLQITHLTLHASGGRDMLKKAMEARDKYLPQTKLLAVTILTSIDEKTCEEVYSSSTKNKVIQLAHMCEDLKVDGIVCSGLELDFIGQFNLIKVCPGIRVNINKSADQKRVLSPSEAVGKGANFLVMGRELRENPNLMKELNF